MSNAWKIIKIFYKLYEYNIITLASLYASSSIIPGFASNIDNLAVNSREVNYTGRALTGSSSTVVCMLVGSTDCIISKGRIYGEGFLQGLKLNFTIYPDSSDNTGIIQF